MFSSMIDSSVSSIVSYSEIKVFDWYSIHFFSHFRVDVTHNYVKETICRNGLNLKRSKYSYVC